MIFWIREILGWLLIALGLGSFFWVYELCAAGKFVELVAPIIVGIVVFRGGVHVLRTAVAARVCQQAQDRLYPAPGVGSAPLPPARAPYRPGGRA